MASSNGQSNIRRGAAGLAVAGAVALGGLTVAAFNPLTSAGAQEGATTTTAPPASAKAHKPSKIVTDALASLVADGTLTQAQADAVRTRLQETAKSVRAERKANRTERRQDLIATAATALGITPEDLLAELKAGKTITEIAEANDVDPKDVTDALVAEADQLVDQAVSDGKIDAARADSLKEKAAKRVARFVEQGGRRARNGD